jgi:hypothetical protein
MGGCDSEGDVLRNPSVEEMYSHLALANTKYYLVHLFVLSCSRKDFLLCLMYYRVLILRLKMHQTFFGMALPHWPLHGGTIMHHEPSRARNNESP